MNAAQLAQTFRRTISLEYSGKSFEAEQLYRQLVAKRPPLDMVHFMYAQFLLRQGRYDEAWPHYMMRLQDEIYQSKPLAQLKADAWSGIEQEGIANKTLLIGCDQGIGDALMCARYIPETAKHFKRVVFMVFKGFRELFSCLEEIENIQIVEFEEKTPDFDLYIDVFSLPAIFETTPDTIPPAKWMTIDPARIADWQGKLGTDRLNVGFSWQGNNQHSRDDERSAPLSAFQPLIACDIHAVSLEVGDALDQISELPSGHSISVYESIASEIERKNGRMLETAALIGALDLVVTVDTAIAHLAGSLGKPCWILLSKVPCWRWMEEGEDSDWYENARLFRSIERYDQTSPVAEMRDRLQSLLNNEDNI